MSLRCSKQEESSMTQTEKRILSFDGGGIRGVISLVFLESLEQEMGISLVERADLLAGTSTGSITAGSLAAGLSAIELINFYLQHGKDIFPPLSFFKKYSPLNPKYSIQGLQHALETVYQEKGIDPKITFGQLSKHILIPAINLDERGVERWQLELFHNLTSDCASLFLIDAMLRSSAAPTYFPSYQNYIDGGVAANDPSALAYALLFSLSPFPPPPFYLLSFGTGFVNHFIPKGEDWGSLSWTIDCATKEDATSTPLLSMMFDVQEELSAQLASLLLGPRFCKLNKPLDTVVKLNDASAIPSLIDTTRRWISTRPAAWQEACAFVEKVFS